MSLGSKGTQTIVVKTYFILLEVWLSLEDLFGTDIDALGYFGVLNKAKRASLDIHKMEAA